MSARLGAAFVVALCLAIPAVGMHPQTKDQMRREDRTGRYGSSPRQLLGVSVDSTLEAMRARDIERRLRRDLERLRALGVSITGRIAAGAPLDYATISKETAEINKRGKSVKSRLMIANAQNQTGPIEIDAACMSDTLTTLCARIHSFVGSPIFTAQGVFELNVNDTTRAADDLRRILDLSASLRRGADRLRQASR